MQPSTADDSEDSEPDVDVTDRVLRSSSRTKRGIGEPSTSYRCTYQVPSSAKLATRPKWLPPGYNVSKLKISSGNPVYGYRVQMFCRTGHHLAILHDRRVEGVQEDRHPCALLEFSSVDFGEVRIKALQTNLYLAMDEDGKLYGEPDSKESATVFAEYALGPYNTYLSRKWAHLGYYVAIKKSGRTKPAYLTRWGQKAIQFLLRRTRS